MEPKDVDLSKIAGNLQRLREERGMQQQDVAAVVGSSPSMISLWESGKRVPGLAVLCLLADYYGTSLDAIVGTPSPRVKLFERWRALTKDLQPEQVEALDYIMASLKPVPKGTHTEDYEACVGSGNKENSEDTKENDRNPDWRRRMMAYYSALKR